MSEKMLEACLMDEIIRPKDLPRLLKISRTTCWRLGRDPASGFPKKIHLASSGASGAVGYFRSELEEYLKARQEK